MTLIVLGLLKLVAWVIPASDAGVSRLDPLLGIPTSQVQWMAGTMELVVGMCCLWARPRMAGALAWLVVLTWLAYHAAGALSGVGGTCPCLGRARSWLPWLGSYEDRILLSVGLWMAILGTVLLSSRIGGSEGSSAE